MRPPRRNTDGTSAKRWERRVLQHTRPAKQAGSLADRWWAGATATRGWWQGGRGRGARVRGVSGQGAPATGTPGLCRVSIFEARSGWH